MQIEDKASPSKRAIGKRAKRNVANREAASFAKLIPILFAFLSFFLSFKVYYWCLPYKIEGTPDHRWPLLLLIRKNELLIRTWCLASRRHILQLILKLPKVKLLQLLYEIPNFVFEICFETNRQRCCSCFRVHGQLVFLSTSYASCDLTPGTDR